PIPRTRTVRQNRLMTRPPTTWPPTRSGPARPEWLGAEGPDTRVSSLAGVARNGRRGRPARPQRRAGQKSRTDREGKRRTPPGEKPDAGPIEELPVAPRENPEGKAPEQPAGQAVPATAAGAAFSTALSTKPKPGERPPYLLKLEQAVELGLINSRE